MPILAIRWSWRSRSTGAALRTLLRSAFFFPFTLSVVTVGLAWLWLLDPVVGPFNYYLRALGAPARSWLADPSTAMWAIIATTLWWVTGYYLVIYLAGLQDIPRDLYEAAAIDGAGGMARLLGDHPAAAPAGVPVRLRHPHHRLVPDLRAGVRADGAGRATPPAASSSTCTRPRSELLPVRLGLGDGVGAVRGHPRLLVLQFRLLRGHTEY